MYSILTSLSKRLREGNTSSCDREDSAPVLSDFSLKTITACIDLMEVTGIITPLFCRLVYHLRRGKDMGEYNEYAVTQRYGQTPSRDLTLGYLKALKVIIGADGEIADAEMAALQDLMQEMGVAADIATEIDEFDYETGKLEEVLPNMKPGGRRARLLLRDAVQIVRADGIYAVEEQAAVAKTAELLKVGSGTLKAIEALVELEEAAAKLHKSIIVG